MDGENQALEPTLDVELAPMMEPAPMLLSETPVSSTPRSRYWQAQGLADMLQSEFDEAQKSGKIATMRERFYLLATYYTRTLAILRNALKERREPLAQAALHNLIALHTSLHFMYTLAPGTIPSTLTLNRGVRSHLIESLIIQILHDSPQPLDLPAITLQVNELDLLAQASEQVISRHLTTLISSGYLQAFQGTYACTTRPYSGVNLDVAALQALLGPGLFQHSEQAGFRGLADVLAHKGEFRSLITTLVGFSDGTAALLVTAAEALVGPRTGATFLQTWRHADLIGSPHIRPYQYEAYAVFRGYGYKAEIIEAPTGSGKTMIGMMCIQDWLRSLSQGQSILVLVPTVNYQQQWVGELCYKPLGLRLSPHEVFTGTPSSLEALHKRTGMAPCVIVMTYTSLAQTGSGVGKGGFDQDSIEIILQGNNIQYVIFDEVHKVVEDVHGVSANVTRILTEWVHDGSLKGAIGFSGTAASYRPRFAQLGMKLVYIMPAAELIAYGFVAPFAEFAIPFAYSDREQRIRDLLDAYKERLREFIALIGVVHLKHWFAEIPMEERLALSRSVLRLSAGQKDRDEALMKRFEMWEQGEELTLTQLPLITLVQLAKHWSDEDLVRAAVHIETQNADNTRGEAVLQLFHELRLKLEAIRGELRPLIYLADTVRRLNAEDFGTIFDAVAVRSLCTEATSNTVRIQRVKDGLATTFVGLYDNLSDWYLRVGEGRVDSIKAIIEAERASRPVHGVIIFDVGNRIRWRTGTATPGYSGVAGVFGQMLGDRRFTPMAVLSSEMYLAYDETDPLPVHIAAFIKREIMLGELGEALFALTTQGLGLSEHQLTGLRRSLDEILAQYVNTLIEIQATRPGEFYRKVLAPFRKAIRKAKLGDVHNKLLARLSLKHYHVRNCVTTFFDYALIADSFLKAHVAELVQVSGALQKFFVVKMPQGERKQLMYDLSARLVDAEDLPINMIIVSPWARTGWNVIKPNVLIDATATRDVTAWQQLRGRAMRALRTWTNECYRLVLLLMSSHISGLEDAGGHGARSTQKGAPGETSSPQDVVIPEHVARAFEELREQSPGYRAIAVLDDASKALLLEAHLKAQMVPFSSDPEEDGLATKVKSGVIGDFTFEERAQLIGELMLARNKVTHIYELVKAYGSTSQVRYDRPTRQWQRSEPISAKHAREYAVSPLSGQFIRGVEHAPLIYSGDPRKDIPSVLQAHITATLQNCDPKIIKGWLGVIANDMQEVESLNQNQ